MNKIEISFHKKKIFADNKISSATKNTLVSCGWLIANMILLSLMVNLCIHIDTIYLDLSISEFSVTESAQILLLITTTLIFFLLSRKNTEIHYAALLISGFFATLAIRELDHIFDMIYHGFWFYPALFVSIVAIIAASRGGIKTINQIAFLMETPYFKQMLSSVILLLFFSRIYGMGSFWREIMGDNYLRDVKNISEEGIELLCYSLICFSAIKVSGYLKK